MQLILEIYEKDVHPEIVSQKDVRYRLRRAARAVLFREGKIALEYVANHGYHKLPGGGIDEGETIIEGLLRELLEEVGARAEVVGELGVTFEYRDSMELMQISYAYRAKVIGNLREPIYTEEEKAEGHTLVWMDITEAIRVMTEENVPQSYRWQFIKKRDLAILEYMKGIM